MTQATPIRTQTAKRAPDPDPVVDIGEVEVEGEAEAHGRKPVLVVLLVIVGLLAGILSWTVASDHHAPSTSRGIVSANVAQIAPRVSGRVIAVEAQDNAILAAGDPLFRLDPRPFELAVEQARSRLAQTVQGVDASGAQIEAAQAQIVPHD